MRQPHKRSFDTTRYKTGSNVTKCHACDAKQHLQKGEVCSFPHRHGDATGKPETRDERRGEHQNAHCHSMFPCRAEQNQICSECVHNVHFLKRSWQEAKRKSTTNYYSNLFAVVVLLGSQAPPCFLCSRTTCLQMDSASSCSSAEGQPGLTSP